MALAFACYIGILMPFICWGAWAVPGHPHSHPHFVFTLPETVPNSHMASHAHHDPKPVEQALPEISLAVHVPLLMLALTLLAFKTRQERLVLRIVFGERQFSPFVPTPPPRISLSR